MPTSKKRINVSLTEELERALQRLAKRDDVPQATKALHLLQLAVEIEEDDVLNSLAEKRDTNGASYVSHEEVWK